MCETPGLRKVNREGAAAGGVGCPVGPVWRFPGWGTTEHSNPLSHLLRAEGSLSPGLWGDILHAPADFLSSSWPFHSL